MSTSAKPAIHTPTSKGGGSKPASAISDKNSGSRQQFLSAALTMSWQLAIVVLVPIIGGVQLDKRFGTKYVCTFIGLAVAFTLSGVVMWRAMQEANKLPVPKLTAKEKRAVQKRYEEDDD